MSLLSWDIDHHFMHMALQEARAAADEGEVPIGAVIAHGPELLARGRNSMERLQDPTAHAEILAIGAACQALGTWRLEECTLYATLEPCPMCAGAALNARIGRIVFGAFDKRLGACGTHWNIAGQNPIGRVVEIRSEVLATESLGLIKGFFSDLREGRRESSARRNLGRTRTAGEDAL